MSENLYQDTMLAAAALHHANDQRTPEQRQAEMVVRGLLYPCEVTDPAVDTGRHHRKVGEEVYIERYGPPGRHRKPDEYRAPCWRGPCWLPGGHEGPCRP
ncbi:Uncharacterised protein [Mycobacteroides abscessus subsp. bolletii]|uniref:hypothetical protein n=1 Tax=Mycobacteroides abscessus TaxID=36809 RepID=UPI0009C7299C|nr:hypothetical protein [Mycobacteroides abscessus]SLD51234.1 Uncharacterised protein [Mycobacteroides abscessus subsp. bolletii]